MVSGRGEQCDSSQASLSPAGMQYYLDPVSDRSTLRSTFPDALVLILQALWRTVTGKDISTSELNRRAMSSG